MPGLHYHGHDGRRSDAGQEQDLGEAHRGGRVQGAVGGGRGHDTRYRGEQVRCDMSSMSAHHTSTSTTHVIHPVFSLDNNKVTP